jgi:hypothetical protein
MRLVIWAPRGLTWGYVLTGSFEPGQKSQHGQRLRDSVNTLNYAGQQHS